MVVGNLSNKTGVLHLDEAVSNAFSGGESGVLGAGSISLLRRVVLSQSVNTNLASHVELVGNGGSSDVEPIWVIWGEVFEACGLIVDSPLISI